METQNFCQSCSMPLSIPELQGTEKDGSKSKEYCMYCYQNGAFVNPTMSLESMKEIVKEKMEERHIDKATIELALRTLPQLKRWSA